MFKKGLFWPVNCQYFGRHGNYMYCIGGKDIMAAIRGLLQEDRPKNQRLCQILCEMIQSLAPDAREVLLQELEDRIEGNGSNRRDGADHELGLLAEAWALYFEVLSPLERNWLRNVLEQNSARVNSNP